jgi:predicted DCC family thiol-disulfide oxidoreductase YuxK
MTSDPTDGAALLYDPDCGFCTRAAGWLRRLGPTAAVVALRVPEALSAPEASPLTERVDLERARREVPYVDADGRVLYGAQAIAAVLRTCQPPWREMGRLMATPPVQALARPVYGWVARNRHRLPGGSAECDLSEQPPRWPPPREQSGHGPGPGFR